MRAIHELLNSRTRVRPRYALIPPDGVPTSRLPAWTAAETRVLAAPALGARFAQYKIDLQAGGGTRQQPDRAVESFIYTLGGEISVSVDQRDSQLTGGGYAYVPHTLPFSLEASKASSLIVVRKRYQPADGIAPGEALVGSTENVPGEPYLGNPHARLQLLIPDDLRYDMAMNIFTFDPGHSLPFVETHVMEHGLLFLQGKGVYLLDDEWMEVQAGDFIWMGPYCPQAFYATGESPARYLYYKDVNREIEL